MTTPTTKTLTRDEKLERLALLEERARREKLKKPSFRHRAHPGQLDVLKSKAIERYVFAGNGSGKTALGAEDTRVAITGVNPYNGEHLPTPCRAYIILDKPDKVENVIIPELRKFMEIRPDQCHKKGKPYISEVAFDDGATIKFIFWDQEPMTAEGIEGDYFWFDEPPPRPLYVALRRAGRTRGRQARYLITGTPLSAPWLRTEVFEPWSKGERGNTECFRFHTEMNSHNLAEGYIEQFSAVLSEKERGIRLRGEFFDLEGLALSHLFRRDTHVVKRDEKPWLDYYPCVLVCDPHPSKPHHVVVMGADSDGRLYVVDEYKEKTVARKFARSLINKGWFDGRYRFIDLLSDSLGSSEMTSGEGYRSFIEVMNEELSSVGMGRMRATTYEEKEDEAFIDRIQDALLIPEEDSFGQRVPKLRFYSHCKGSISDVENVQWATDKRTGENKPKLEISNKDFLSCVKYALATNIRFNKSKDKAYYRRGAPYGVKLDERRKLSMRGSFKRKLAVKTGDEWDD